ncbi:hypothetical protein R6G99_07830, partial [Actinotignum timonense]|nr:hypothetical protein [Actinotignum timonense]
MLTTPAQASRWRWSPRTLGAFAVALLGGLLILGVLAWLGRDPGPSADEEESFTGEDSRDSFKKK